MPAGQSAVLEHLWCVHDPAHRPRCRATVLLLRLSTGSDDRIVSVPRAGGGAMAKALAGQLSCLRLLCVLSPAAPDAVSDTLQHIQRQLQGRPMHPQVTCDCCKGGPCRTLP